MEKTGHALGELIFGPKTSYYMQLDTKTWKNPSISGREFHLHSGCCAQSVDVDVPRQTQATFALDHHVIKG